MQERLIRCNVEIRTSNPKPEAIKERLERELELQFGPSARVDNFRVVTSKKKGEGKGGRRAGDESLASEGRVQHAARGGRA